MIELIGYGIGTVLFILAMVAGWWDGNHPDDWRDRWQ